MFCTHWNSWTTDTHVHQLTMLSSTRFFPSLSRTLDRSGHQEDLSVSNYFCVGCLTLKTGETLSSRAETGELSGTLPGILQLEYDHRAVLSVSADVGSFSSIRIRLVASACSPSTNPTNSTNIWVESRSERTARQPILTCTRSPKTSTCYRRPRRHTIGRWTAVTICTVFKRFVLISPWRMSVSRKPWISAGRIVKLRETQITSPSFSQRRSSATVYRSNCRRARCHWPFGSLSCIAHFSPTYELDTTVPLNLSEIHADTVVKIDVQRYCSSTFIFDRHFYLCLKLAPLGTRNDYSLVANNERCSPLLLQTYDQWYYFTTFSFLMLTQTFTWIDRNSTYIFDDLFRGRYDASDARDLCIVMNRTNVSVSTSMDLVPCTMARSPGQVLCAQPPLETIIADQEESPFV